jgi:hypothetical protein
MEAGQRNSLQPGAFLGLHLKDGNKHSQPRKRLDLQERYAKPKFPTKDGVMWKPQGLLWAQMCAVFGSEFVVEECRKMNVWLLDHPSQWKTCNGMPRFMNSWLKRSAKTVKIAQNRPTDAWMSQGAADMSPLELEMTRADLRMKAAAAEEQFNRRLGRIQ